MKARAASAGERFATAGGFDGRADDVPFIASRSLPVTHRDLDVGAVVLVSEAVPRGGSEWRTRPPTRSTAISSRSTATT